jgi:hypothetical protein
MVLFKPTICTTSGAEFSDDERAVMGGIEHTKRATTAEATIEHVTETKTKPEPSFLPIIDHAA